MKNHPKAKPRLDTRSIRLLTRSWDQNGALRRAEELRKANTREIQHERCTMNNESKLRDPLGQLSADDLEDMTTTELALELAAEVKGFLNAQWFVECLKTHGLETAEIEVSYLRRLAAEIDSKALPR